MDATTEDGRWLTYAEMAESRGISKASATRISFRHKWRRQAGNDGSVRVFVPASALHDKPHDSDMARMALAMEAAMDLFRQQATAAEARAERAEAGREAADRRADQAEARADRAEAGMEAARRRADQADARADQLAQRWAEELAGERARVDAIQVQHQKVLKAVEAEEAIRQADRARGRLARLRTAWRGE